MKKGLLASSALIGASLLGTPAFAAAPTVADNFQVTITGNMRSTFIWYDQDQDTVTGDNGRGFTFRGNDESEIAFRARGKSDFGISYGFDIEVMTQTNDSLNSDEVWMFIDGAFGRVEIGDQDDAPDRMFVGGEDAQAGRGGLNVGITDAPITRTGLAGVDSASLTRVGDSSKIIYFSPRMSGFQVGFSWTPDAGQGGGEAANDTGAGEAAPETATFFNVFGFGVNYQNTFGDVKVTVGGSYQTGEDEVDANEDYEIWGGGFLLAYAGFTLGVGYVDQNETGVSKANANLGAEAGQWWDVGLKYTTGPWDFSVGYFHGWAEQATGTDDRKATVYAASATYRIAPGWTLAGDIAHFDYETRGGTNGNDVDGLFFIFSSTMTF